MVYISVTETAKKWNVSERSVRNYCANDRVPGAILHGKTWSIPADAEKPERSNKKNDSEVKKEVKEAKEQFVKGALLESLQKEKEGRVGGGVYHKTQIALTYNSKQAADHRLTHDQVRRIFEENTIRTGNETLNLDDVIEIANHFGCIDFVIENAEATLNEKLIKKLHQLLKEGTREARLGEVKYNLADDASDKLKAIINEYNKKKEKKVEDILDFYVAFERMQPFGDGNGRAGLLLMFKECLKYNIKPFIFDEEMKDEYWMALEAWDSDKSILLNACAVAQEKYQAYLENPAVLSDIKTVEVEVSEVEPVKETVREVVRETRKDATALLNFENLRGIKKVTSKPVLFGYEHFDEEGTLIGSSKPGLFNGTFLQYDGNGNLIGRSVLGMSGSSYTHYDREGKEIGTTHKGIFGTGSIHYDAEGNEVGKTHEGLFGAKHTEME